MEINSKRSARSATTHIGALDGLRTYAAIGIVLIHVSMCISIKPTDTYFTRVVIPDLMKLTSLFMIVSAFSLCCGYYERFKSGLITPNDFYRKRYQRILPFFASLCVLDFIISPSMEQLYMLFANLTLCFSFIPNQDISMIGVGWFLGLIFVFYLLFPFYVFMLDNRRRGWFSFLISLVLAGLCTVYSFNESVTTPNVGGKDIIYNMPLFIAGGMIYLYRDSVRMKGIRLHLWLLVCLFLTMSYSLFPFLNESYFYTLVTNICIFGSWLVYALSSKDWILNNRLVRFLSTISMEIYLSHMLLFRLVEKFHLERIIADVDLLFVVTFLLVLIGTIVFSYVMKQAILPNLTKGLSSLYHRCCR